MKLILLIASAFAAMLVAAAPPGVSPTGINKASLPHVKRDAVKYSAPPTFPTTSEDPDPIMTIALAKVLLGRGHTAPPPSLPTSSEDHADPLMANDIEAHDNTDTGLLTPIGNSPAEDPNTPPGSGYSDSGFDTLNREATAEKPPVCSKCARKLEACLTQCGQWKGLCQTVCSCKAAQYLGGVCARECGMKC
jgi:hypothetical protein